MTGWNPGWIGPKPKPEQDKDTDTNLGREGLPSTDTLRWLRQGLMEGLRSLGRRLQEIDKELSELEEELRRSFPKHAVVQKWVKCGKSGCHCARPGDRGHGPYFYLVMKQEGKVKTKYLGTKPPDEIGEGGIPAREYRSLQSKLRRLRRERELLLERAQRAVDLLRG